VSGTAQRFETLGDAASALGRRELSPSELLDETLQRVDAEAGSLNCFLNVMADDARIRARELERIPVVDRTPLWGIPMSVKDCFATTSAPTTAGSPLLKSFIPTYDAYVVRQLWRAGAVIFAKDNMYDFAYCGPNPAFGDAVNPWGEDRTCGGSSSGSASAVASGLSYASVGSDGGGSIRMPAAFCGVVGLKPTTGLVSGKGEIPCQGTVSCAGPIARTVTDAALVLTSLLGEVVATQPGPSPQVEGVTLGVARAAMAGLVNPDVLAAFEDACAVLEREGASLREVTLPNLEAARTVMWIISGVEYAEALRQHLRESSEQMHPVTRMLLERAEYVPATEYIHAQRVRRRIAAEMVAAMGGVDAILLPTTPTPAYKRTEAASFAPESDEHPLSLSTSFTAIFNITGQPALTVPCGFSRAGLPIGLQIVGRPGGEGVIFPIGHAYEAATDWHLRRPVQADRRVDVGFGR
jgi:aspartyl-tRNA(Asn)/glutamyl-tRNA(Gln) amidotransferase subunit A